MKISLGFLAIAVSLASLIVGTAASRAETLDLKALTCKEFLEKGQDDIATAVAWLDGYNKNEDDPAVVDFDKLKENAEALSAYCNKNPNAAVADAAEELFGK